MATRINNSTWYALRLIFDMMTHKNMRNSYMIKKITILTVLSFTCYSIFKTFLNGESRKSVFGILFNKD